VDVAVAVWCGPSSPNRGDNDGASARSRLVIVRATESTHAAALDSQDAADHELMDRVRQSDPAALATLLHRHGESLARYAITIVHSRDTAQDVVQDVFIKVWEIRETMTLAGSVSGYLLRMTRNRALNVARHERALARAAHDAYLNAPDLQYQVYNAGDARLTAAELARLARQAIAELPERSREVFLMRRQARLPASAVAEALGITQAAVHVHLSRALRRIAEHIGRHLE